MHTRADQLLTQLLMEQCDTSQFDIYMKEIDAKILGFDKMAAMLIKNIKMSSFKSSENFQKKEDGPDRSVSDNQSSSVTLNEQAMKARKLL